ncbi:MAG: hypothetical protein Q7S88_00675 [Candidatus Daviesbacteria bacterium]|nr:hypothetical protein [Candidatus Daviesbacteria bacterium]
MNRIKVNLLPAEILIERKKSLKLTLLNKLSISMLVILLFLASASLALRFTQSEKFKNINENLVFAEGKVTSLKGKEAKVVALKQRLRSIDTLLSADSKIREIFDLAVSSSSGVDILDVSISKNGNMTISFSSDNLEGIEGLIINMINKGREKNLISEIFLEGLTLGKDGFYKFELRVTTI